MPVQVVKPKVFPTKIGVGEAFPDIEVRIMASTNFMLHKYQPDAVKFPLTAGPDTNVDITLTIAWDQKVFSSDTVAKRRTSDVFRLIQSDIMFEATDPVLENYLGDLVRNPTRYIKMACSPCL